MEGSPVRRLGLGSGNLHQGSPAETKCLRQDHCRGQKCQRRCLFSSRALTSLPTCLSFPILVLGLLTVPTVRETLGFPVIVFDGTRKDMDPYGTEMKKRQPTRYSPNTRPPPTRDPKRDAHSHHSCLPPGSQSASRG